MDLREELSDPDRTTRLRCPPPQPMPGDLRPRLETAAHRMVRLSESLASVSARVGIEIRVASALLAREIELAFPHPEYAHRKLRECLLRPAIEPALLSSWQLLSLRGLGSAALPRFLEMVVASPVEPRSGVGYSENEGKMVVFESPKRLAVWDEKIRLVAANPKFVLESAFFAYAQTALAHPFSDGNGRLARSILHVGLAEPLGIKQPFLALAPAFYANQRTISATLTHLSQTGEWAPYYDAALATIELATQLTEQIATIR